MIAPRFAAQIELRPLTVTTGVHGFRLAHVAPRHWQAVDDPASGEHLHWLKADDAYQAMKEALRLSEDWGPDRNRKLRECA